MRERGSVTKKKEREGRGGERESEREREVEGEGRRRRRGGREMERGMGVFFSLGARKHEDSLMLGQVDRHTVGGMGIDG